LPLQCVQQLCSFFALLKGLDQLLPLLLKTLNRGLVTHKIYSFNLPHEMSMVVVVRIIKTKHSPVVTCMHQGIDVGQVVPCDSGHAFDDRTPNFITQQSAARFWFELEPFLFQQLLARKFGLGFCHRVA
ncbi:MAG: hypothetical protein ACK55Z_15300, partial [bacterium]